MLAVLLAVLGCQSYLDDAERRTPGEVADDVTILTLVKTRLVRDPAVGGLRINVGVAKGVVTLDGNVGSESARQRAVEIAGSVPNVEQVVDRLAVRL